MTGQLVPVIALSTMLAAPVAASAPAPAIVMLTVNDRELGVVRVDVDNEDFCIPAATLTEAGIAWQHATTGAIDNAPCVWARTVRPGLGVTFADATGELHLTAGPEMFSARQTIRLSSQPPALERVRGAGAFLNYSLGGDEYGGARYAGELGLSLRRAVLQANVSGQFDGRLERGPVAVVVDDERRMARWRVGDLFGGASLRGGVLPLAGISVAREYAIDPYFVRYSPLSLSGASARPATAEIYVNGQLVSRQRVAPGTFELADLPAPVGSGTARVVIRDDFGRTEELGTSFYRAPGVLGRGMQEYRYAVGAQRVDELIAPWRYRGVVAAAEHRVGVTDSMTIGGRVEASEEIVSGGPSFVVATPLGELGVEASASRGDTLGGRAGAMSYAYRGSRASIGVTGRYYSRGYSDLTRVDDIAPRSDVLAWAGLGLFSRLSVSIQANAGESWTGLRRTTGSLTLNVPLGRGATATAAFFRTRIDGRDGRQASLLVTMPLGARTSVTAGSVSTRGESSTATVSAQRSLPFGPGVGYRAQWQERDTSAVTGAIEAQSSFGRMHAQHDRWSNRSQSSVTVSGAVVAAAGGLHLTRPIDDAFAVVRVPGVRGVKAFLSNQYVGRTNRSGSLVVPSLISYYGNRLSVAPDDLPLDVSLAREVAIVAPSFRAGALVTFQATTAWPVIGRVELLRDGVRTTPAYGGARATWSGGQAESPLGEGGEFFFEGVSPGRRAIEVDYMGDTFTCTVDVPVLTEIVDLGVVTCTPAPRMRRQEP